MGIENEIMSSCCRKERDSVIVLIIFFQICVCNNSGTSSRLQVILGAQM